MAPNGFTSAWQTFWHSITSNDRHASFNSPYRTGQHVPLSQSRNAPLTSVATNAADSHVDLTSPSLNEGSDPSSPFYRRSSANTGGPYEPGMKSAMSRTNSDDASGAPSEVQMQTFSDGLPPPPPISHSWKRIDRWTEENYEELWDNMGGPCSQNDINELEHELDCTLPQDVRESLQVHDGQERGGMPTGIIFGCMLLDCEEIVEEWKNWRLVNEEYLTARTIYEAPQLPPKAFAASSSSNPPTPVQTSSNTNKNWREDLLERQDSQPTGAIQKSYTHPAWIPLARDWGGNCLAVDLAPGPAGKWGQVIIMGRDYDCKYVVGRSWASFLATVADDFASKKVFVNEENSELKLREFRQQGVEPAYIDILRWRADQKYGRKPPRKRPGDSRMNASVAAGIARGSPYSSPTPNEGDRGRSPHRFSGKGPSTQSPRGTISSPLARVAEETPNANGPASPTGSRTASVAQPLVSMDTPRDSVDSKSADQSHGASSMSSLANADKENQKIDGVAGLGMKNVDLSEPGQAVDDMKTVEI